MKNAVKMTMLLLLTILLSSCSFMYSDIPSKDATTDEKAESYTWVNEIHSYWGYNQLEDKLKIVYDDIVEAWISLDESLSTEKVEKDELSDVMENILYDYPAITWVEREYSYKSFLANTKINFSYSMDNQELNAYMQKIDLTAEKLISDIPPEMSRFEKATIVHDKIAQLVEYDIDAAHQSQAYGALIDNRAACQGYSKAYQLLMLKLGIDSVIVVGEATEPHAWNMVELDDGYYYVDVTFDDSELLEGGGYLSREYLFLDESMLRLTHTPTGNGSRYQLPECNSTQYNYFAYNNLLITEENSDNLLNQLKQLTDNAIQNEATELQIKIYSTALAEELTKTMFSTGLADQAVSSATSRHKGVDYIGRLFDDSQNIYTFILEYNPK